MAAAAPPCHVPSLICFSRVIFGRSHSHTYPRDAAQFSQNELQANVAPGQIMNPDLRSPISLLRSSPPLLVRDGPIMPFHRDMVELRKSSDWICPITRGLMCAVSVIILLEYVGRACGVVCDLRKSRPFANYDFFQGFIVFSRRANRHIWTDFIKNAIDAIIVIWLLGYDLLPAYPWRYISLIVRSCKIMPAKSKAHYGHHSYLRVEA